MIFRLRFPSPYPDQIAPLFSQPSSPFSFSYPLFIFPEWLGVWHQWPRLGHSYWLNWCVGDYERAPLNPDFLEQPCELQVAGLPLGCLWCFKRERKLAREVLGRNLDISSWDGACPGVRPHCLQIISLWAAQHPVKHHWAGSEPAGSWYELRRKWPDLSVTLLGSHLLGTNSNKIGIVVLDSHPPNMHYG